MFLQSLPTKQWTEKDIELLLSEAFIWQSLFKGSAAHLKEVELISKALDASLGPEADDPPLKARDPGFIDPDRARYANARNGTIRTAQRVSSNLTSRELELVNKSKQSRKDRAREPTQVPLPDEESSVDEEAENDDDFISVASGRLNDADVNAAVLQTMNDGLDLQEEQGNDPNAPLVGGESEKSKFKTTMEGVIWRLYNRQLGGAKENSAQLSA